MKTRFKNFLGHMKQHKFHTALVLLLVLLLAPHRIHSQLLPDPCCPILSAGLTTIADLLKTVVGGPLAQIQTIQDEINKYQREVIWPQEAINKAKQLAGMVGGMVSTIRGYIQMTVNSATLEQPLQLEKTLLSRNSNLVNQVTTDYSAVYQTVPAATDAPPEMRNLIDMNDAMAMSAMKRAIQIDAMVEVQLQAAETIAGELNNTAAGTAPMIGAQATAWLVRSNAYTQWALSELMRVRSAQLASEGAGMKFGVGEVTRARNDINRLNSK
jgi:hypothetical protein